MPRTGWRGVGGGASASFVYDGDGQRMKATFGSSTVYIGDPYEQTGSTIRKHYYANGQRMAVRVGGVVYYLHADHLGSATLTTDINGNRVGELRYTPYGLTRYEWGSTPTNHRFTGQRWEGALGLYDYRARFYDPALGRFVQADTIVPEPGNPQALNRYSYVLGNPLRYTDPTGHCPLCVAVGILIIKAVDYGWTAYDVYQSGQTLANPLATDEDKLIASFNIALAVGLEAAEPDDWLPASLPLDDLARRGVVAGLREAIQERGLRAGVQFIRETMGEAAPQVIRHLYDRGLFRDIRSARDWNEILKGVRREAGLEVHHLIEQRFAEQLGLKAGDIPSVVLKRTFHQQEVTARLFSELPTGGKYFPQDIWNAYKRVYGEELKHWDWVEAIWPYFQRWGVQR